MVKSLDLGSKYVGDRQHGGRRGGLGGGGGGRGSVFFLLNTPIPKCYWYLNLTVRGGGGDWIKSSSTMTDLDED